MSTRAIASQRNKRTSASNNPPPIPKTGRSPASNTQQNNTNPRRELSVQEAFSLMNNKISNLEKAVFEGDFTRPSTTSMPPKQDEIEDIYKQLQEIKEGITTQTSNPYTSINTVTTFDTINAELLMMKNDIMGIRSTTQGIDNLSEEVSQIKSCIETLGFDTHVDIVEKVNSLETYVNEIKDIIIKLQNFTLEINDMCIKNIKANAFDPYSIVSNDDDDFPESDQGIIINHNEDGDIFETDDINEVPNHVTMTINESEPEPETLQVQKVDTNDEGMEWMMGENPDYIVESEVKDEVPEEPQPITNDCCNDCDDCDNCETCVNCTNCKDCIECKECSSCVGCVGCTNCENCVDCEGCDGLKDQTGVKIN